MKKFLSIGVCWLAVTGAAAAAELHGTVSENEKPLPQGVSMKLQCGDTTASARTDEFGSYSLKVAATGACTLSLDYKGSTATLKVTLYEKPTRYDLVVKEAAGKLGLARK